MQTTICFDVDINLREEIQFLLYKITIHTVVSTQIEKLV